ncbi:MAG TPA: hypothetical protein VIS49_05855 [Cyclobacteriaceae bacterium]|jgi:hypothetical protein
MADGTLKNKVSSTELNNRHWQKYEEMEGEIGLNTTGTKPVSGWVKAKLDLEFLTNLEVNR